MKCGSENVSCESANCELKLTNISYALAKKNSGPLLCELANCEPKLNCVIFFNFYEMWFRECLLRTSEL